MALYWLDCVWSGKWRWHIDACMIRRTRAVYVTVCELLSIICAERSRVCAPVLEEPTRIADCTCQSCRAASHLTSTTETEAISCLGGAG